MSVALTIPLAGVPPVGRDRPASSLDHASPAAFARAYEADAERILRHIRARVGDPDLAEDLTAQTFLRAWQSIARYKPVPGRPFIAWLFTIANNLVVDHYRRNRRELVGVKGDPPDTRCEDPERSALNGALRDEIRHALTRLKPEQQMVVTLRLIEGLEYDEISAVMGKSSGALRVLLCRSLNTLRAELRKRGVSPH